MKILLTILTAPIAVPVETIASFENHKERCTVNGYDIKKYYLSLV